MRKGDLSKTEAKKKIEGFFENLENKSQKETRKIKKLAMSFNIKLGDKRKIFCKKCFSTRLRVLGIKNKIKRVRCEDCKNLMRWKVR